MPTYWRNVPGKPKAYSLQSENVSSRYNNAGVGMGIVGQKLVNILLIEDQPGDADLVLIALREIPDPSKVVIAQTLDDTRKIGATGAQFDVILVDLALPDSFGFATVASVREIYPEAPMIVLTGVDDSRLEQEVVEFGAQDYLLKGSYDGRLLMRSVRHAIVRHKLEQRLVASEKNQRTIINLAPDAILVVASDNTVLSANPGAAKIFNYVHPEQMLGQPIQNILPELLTVCDGGLNAAEVRCDSIGLRHGDPFPVSLALASLGDGRMLVMAADITERIRLTNELQELARTDPLTGLVNRRAFISVVEMEFHRCRRAAVQSAILMVDIDCFKRVNDVYGHEAGDRALIAVARVLKTSVRANDLVARFGGEEFVVLLTDISASGSAEIAERIRQMVACIEVVFAENKFNFTVSIGVSMILPQDSSWSEALRRADSAMYVSKSSGRNAVTFA